MSVVIFSNLTVQFNHSIVFNNLSATLSSGISALTGVNGIGKSVLLKVLSGEIQPASGHVQWFSDVYHHDQQLADGGPRVADAVGIGDLYDSFQRIELGCATLDDFAKTAHSWGQLDSWRAALASAGLAVSLDTLTATMSGGERVRLALCSAFRKKDHFLLLDEPGNHLDSDGRRWLCECLENHHAGSLVVSHDPVLLSAAGQLFELDQHGLSSHGSYQDWQLWRKRQQQALDHEVMELTKQNKKLMSAHQDNLRKAARRRQQGEKLRRDGSQGKLLLDARADQAQRTSAREQVQTKKREQLVQANRQQLLARRQLLQDQHLPMPSVSTHGGVLFTLNDVALPFDRASGTISWTVRHGERWRLKGANGAGKSTLLKALAGLLPLHGGSAQLCRNTVYLDQHLSLLDTSQSALDNLMRLAPGRAATDWRTWLGSLRIGGEKALMPLSALSGGERLKVALLGLSRTKNVPEVLLLDEPDNHLDTDTRHVLACSLASYRGAIVLVSHQQSFVDEVMPEFEFNL
ncbi:MAG: ATP-binding cassette domain-containing protein [Gammaproteobacteria bacterium]|nr:ATP-binding cassette domain-containing protein [Gammaproteobacteria bacterium]